MGSPKKNGRKSVGNEFPHEVVLSNGYYMGVHQVTQEQWQAVMGNNNPSRWWHGQNLPVNNISWDDCQAFTKRLRNLDGQAYRLPTEAEWEYACRAGTSTAFHFGETLSSDQANYNDRSFGGQPTPVGSFLSNAWGLHDMHGNAWEWCQDWFSYGPYPGRHVVDPHGPENGAKRVLRGGSYESHQWHCRSAYRSRAGHDTHCQGYGVRLCFCL